MGCSDYEYISTTDKYLLLIIRIANKRYAEGNLKMIEQNVRKKLKLEPSEDDFQEVLEQLKEEV